MLADTSRHRVACAEDSKSRMRCKRIWRLAWVFLPGAKNCICKGTSGSSDAYWASEGSHGFQGDLLGGRTDAKEIFAYARAASHHAPSSPRVRTRRSRLDPRLCDCHRQNRRDRARRAVRGESVSLSVLPFWSENPEIPTIGASDGRAAACASGACRRAASPDNGAPLWPGGLRRPHILMRCSPSCASQPSGVVRCSTLSD